jgi:hypothetical protein
MATLLTHELALHTTNSRGIVPVCSCGWLGTVHPTHVRPGHAPGRQERARERANEAAEAQHREHVKRDGPLTYTLPPEQFIPVVLNTRRFGHA